MKSLINFAICLFLLTSNKTALSQTTNADSSRYKATLVRCIENVKLLEKEVDKRDYLMSVDSKIINKMSDSLKVKNLKIGEQKTKIKHKNTRIFELIILNIASIYLFIQTI